MKKIIIPAVFLLFAIAFVLSFDKSEHISYFSIAIFIILGIGLNFLVYMIRDYSNPPQWLFRLRFLVYSLSYGLFFGAAMTFFTLIRTQQVDLIQFLLFSAVFALIGFFRGSALDNTGYLRFKKLVKSTGNQELDDLALTDSAYYEDSIMFRTYGRLILDNERLYFYSSDENKCLFESKLTEMNPVVERSSFLNTPVGLDFQVNETKIFMKFPYYWLNAIVNE